MLQKQRQKHITVLVDQAMELTSVSTKGTKTYREQQARLLLSACVFVYACAGMHAHPHILARTLPLSKQMCAYSRCRRRPRWYAQSSLTSPSWQPASTPWMTHSWPLRTAMAAIWSGWMERQGPAHGLCRCLLRCVPPPARG